MFKIIKSSLSCFNWRGCVCYSGLLLRFHHWFIFCFSGFTTDSSSSSSCSQSVVFFWIFTCLQCAATSKLRNASHLLTLAFVDQFDVSLFDHVALLCTLFDVVALDLLSGTGGLFQRRIFFCSKMVNVLTFTSANLGRQHQWNLVKMFLTLSHCCCVSLVENWLFYLPECWVSFSAFLLSSLPLWLLTTTWTKNATNKLIPMHKIPLTKWQVLNIQGNKNNYLSGDSQKSIIISK